MGNSPSAISASKETSVYDQFSMHGKTASDMFVGDDQTYFLFLVFFWEVEPKCDFAPRTS